ncbi:uncharacterized protein METZ01_LOCUS465535, partial [marine metagenome]
SGGQPGRGSGVGADQTGQNENGPLPESGSGAVV